MENKQTSKKIPKKIVYTPDKSAKTVNSKKKKNSKNRKSSSKADPNKDSDPSPDNLEIEGVGVHDPVQGIESDSSQQQCQESVSKTESTSNVGEEGEGKVLSAKIPTTHANLASSPKVDTLEDSKISQSLSNLTISKQKSILPKGISRQKSSISNVQSIHHRQGYQFGAKFAKRFNESNQNLKLLAKNESLRWDNPASNSDDEDERIRVYKINRRKRYLAAAQAKGLGWAANYRMNGSPMSEDSGIDIKDNKDNRTSNHNNSRCDNHGSVPDYSAMKSLAPNTSSSGLAMVEC